MKQIIIFMAVLLCVGIVSASTNSVVKYNFMNWGVITIDPNGINGTRFSWDNLTNVPAGFADGIDNTGAGFSRNDSAYAYNLNISGQQRFDNLKSQNCLGTDADGDVIAGTCSGGSVIGYTEENFTINYNERGDRYSKANYSAQYLASGWKIANQSAREGAYFKIANWTALFNTQIAVYQKISDAWKLANFTAALSSATSGWDKSSADDMTYGNITSKWSAIDLNTADDWNKVNSTAREGAYFKLANFTSAFNVEVPLCGAGQYITSSDGNDLTCDTPAGGGGGGAGDKWLDLGSKITPNSTFARDVLINGTLYVKDWSNLTKQLKIQGYDINISDDFDNENFTTRYNLRTDRFSNINFSARYDAITNRFSNGNFSIRYDLRVDRWSIANTSAYLIANGYNKSISLASYITSTQYPNFDTSSLDDMKYGNITTKWSAIDLNTADDWNKVNQTAKEGAYWKLANFTSAYNLRTDRYTDANASNVAVGGEVSGTIASITLSNTALDDQYILRENTSMPVSNATTTSFKIREYNSTCTGFRFGTTGGLILSCS